jgi:hypothetical protein
MRDDILAKLAALKERLERLEKRGAEEKPAPEPLEKKAPSWADIEARVSRLEEAWK